MRCSSCGAENPDEVCYCSNCGTWLRGQYPGAQASQPASRRAGGKVLLLTVALVGSVVVVSGIFAYLSVHNASSAHLEMTNWEYATGAGVVVFFADVENTGETLGSATIQCEITYGNGDTYTGERDITLVPGQSDRLVISVMTSLSHLEDSSGTFDCRISV